jgi:hypothetical protein
LVSDDYLPTRIGGGLLKGAEIVTAGLGLARLWGCGSVELVQGKFAAQDDGMIY